MRQIMENGTGIGFEPMPDKRCPYCGHTLHQLTHTVASGKVVYLPVYENCTCAESIQERTEAAAAKAEKEHRKAQERHREKTESLMAASGIHGRYASRTLENYQVPPGDKRALTIVSNYVKKFSEMRKKGMGLYLYGENGLGKTHLAYGAAHELIGQEIRAICRSATDIMLDFRGQMDGAAAGTEYETMRHYQTCDLLVIDDLGKQQVTDWSLSQLFSIIDGRYQDMRPVIVTTNYGDTALADRLALKCDRETAESIVSRLHEMAYDVPVSGQDYRSR